MNVLESYPPVLCFSMTGNAKSNEIAQIIGNYFVCKKSSSNFMVNVQSFFRKFFFMLTAHNTFMTIPVNCRFPLRLPTVSVIFYWMSLNVHRVFFATAIKTSAYFRAIYCFFIVWLFCENFTANWTGNITQSSAFIVTFAGAVFIFSSRYLTFYSVKLFTAGLAIYNKSCSAGGDLTRFAAISHFMELQKYLSSAELFPALFATQCYHFHKKLLHLFRMCRYLGGTEANGVKSNYIITSFSVTPRYMDYIT